MQDPLPALLAFSASAGAIAFINPCGIALLPAYVSFYVGVAPEEAGLRVGTLARAVLLGLLATAGFMAVFGGAGAVLAAIGVWAIRYVPWLAAVLGLAIIGVGVALLLGYRPSVAVPSPDASKLVAGRGIIYFPLFGVAYALASLSCTIPIFLYVTLQALSLGGFAEAMTVFIAYSAGMGASMTAFTLALVVAGGLVRRFIYRVLPYTMRLAGAVMIAAGAYILYWQLFVGGLLG